MLSRILILCILTLTLAACAAAPTVLPTAVATIDIPTRQSSATAQPTQAAEQTTKPVAADADATATDAPTASSAITVASATTVASAATAASATSGPAPTLGPDGWKDMPVAPTGVSKRVQLIYEMGLMKGNNPKAYSKVGDCNNTLPGFMADFDTPGGYKLAGYSSLQETVDYFAGSHARKSLAAKDGLTAHAALSMLWIDWKECTEYETPLTCEYRIQKPMFAIISFGTNDANGTVDFDKALRRVVDMTIGNGTIPILATKADNAEGDNSINRIIVDLANEYELPVWNYWAAVQPLPNHGIDPERTEHLTQGPAGFTSFDDKSLQFAWPVRNLTALQVLDVLRRALEVQ